MFRVPGDIQRRLRLPWLAHVLSLELLKHDPRTYTYVSNETLPKGRLLSPIRSFVHKYLAAG